MTWLFLSGFALACFAAFIELMKLRKHAKEAQDE
jgi:hypothetical protein